MTALAAALLALAVACAWLGAAALVRLPALGRIHAVSFVNTMSGGAVAAAALLTDGVTPRTGKVLLIWAVLMTGGALGSHALGRAVHLRSGGAAMTVLVGAMLLLAGISGTTVVLSRDPKRQVFAIAANGVVLGTLFFVLQAPDVALSQMAVGGAATPLLFLVTLAAIRMNASRP